MRRPTAPSGRTLLVLGLALAVVPPAVARAPEALELQAYTLAYQSAEGAVQLVLPLLSEAGTVELRPGSNTLVVRDVSERLVEVRRVVSDYDHPSSPLRFEIQIVRAGAEEPASEGGQALAPALATRLKELLRYDSYRLLAGTDLAVREGEQVSYRFGDEFGVGFRLGTLLADGRVKLHGFRILRDLGDDAAQDGFGERQLIHTNLNLWLGKPMILGLAKAESSDKALMVVLTCTREEAGD